MFKNYITIAIRNLIRNKLYSVINIGGLAIGLATTMLIALFVIYELSYDLWLPDSEQIYKVEFTETEPGREPNPSATTSSLLAAALVKDYPDIEATVRLKEQTFTVNQGERQFNEAIYLADASFFNVFDLPVVQGNREAALASKNGIAISEDMAIKYFGDRPAVGQILTLNGAVDHVVEAVFQNIPGNTHFNMDFIALIGPDPTSQYGVRESWGSDYVHTYIKVGADFDLNILKTDQRGFAERNITLTWTDQPPAELHFYNLIPISDIHLYSNKSNHEEPVGDINTVVTFAIIAAMILALAVINFTNLATAQAQKRSREVGMRKVLGASRPQLIRQFLGEAVLTGFIALILALVLAELAMPFYNNFLRMDLALSPLADPSFALGGVALVLLTGLVGGIYPALVLSGFRPSTVLHASQSGHEAAPWFRNALVVLQFSISIALIAATSIVYLQTNFARTIDLGFSPDGKVFITALDDRVGPVSGILREEFGRIPGVNEVAQTSTHLPMTEHGPLVPIVPPNASRDEQVSLAGIWSGPNFFNLMDMQPLAGRFFSAGRRADFRNAPDDENQPITRSAVLNEAGVQILGFENPEDAVGQLVTIPSQGQETLVTIVGVVPDANLDSLYSAIGPIIFFVSDAPLSFILLDIDGANQAVTLAEIERVWQDLLPGVTMTSSFLEDAYAALYREADRQGQLFSIFAAFAIFVASLGLYGLSAHMAELRTKEIGIRKVVGARVRDIVALLTWQFSKPVMIAAPFGIFVAVWAMRDWLNDFAYRISLINNTWVFAAAVAAAFIIAWATVAGHARRVARKNPIKALSHE